LAALYPSFSRSSLNHAVKAGRVTVDGKPVKPSLIVKAGQEIVFFPPPPPTPLAWTGAEPPYAKLFEDQNILIINKPMGLVTHPGQAVAEPTLLDALLAFYPELSEIESPHRPGIVHRLDKDTTGVMAIAKNSHAQAFLIQAFADRKVKKRYLAFVSGHPPKSGLIDSPIGRHPTLRHKMAAGSPLGVPARTFYRVLKRFPKVGVSLLSINLFTGRTHQARVHLSSLKFPIIGDKVYGPQKSSLLRNFPSLEPYARRQLLHARSLSVPLPQGGRRRFSAPWPPDFLSFFNELSKIEKKP
jgi:23S rRNA pseudouridine1911/1915/1917 synthase